jgi:hypothetical protein
MIKLDDAVDVVKRILADWYGTRSEELAYIRSELEQKAWIDGYQKDDPVNRLYDLIKDINPEEIAEQVKVDNLIDWCDIIRVEMELAMVQMTEQSQKGEKWQSRRL